MPDRIQTEADTAIARCLKEHRSFALIAGAGSGKTTSLVDALDVIRVDRGAELRKHGQRIACITYTNRAVDVVRDRLGLDDLYHVSTIHGFLWGEIGRFQRDIRDALSKSRIPSLIKKAREKDNGGSSQGAIRAREQVARLEADLAAIDDDIEFVYDDAMFSDYANGRLSHDDVIELGGYLLAHRPLFRRLLGTRYPYTFVDEAQDTFLPIIEGLNLTSPGEGLPLIAYFGDPWQQIYDGRAGRFEPPSGGKVITKTENFRSAPEVIKLLNACRKDVVQFAAGYNNHVKGSVKICLVQAEDPKARRSRYTDEQLQRALSKFDEVVEAWDWQNRSDIIRLFLVRQMIARRLGFHGLNQLFTGRFASQRAKDGYESGDHYLLKPIVGVLCPLLAAYRADDQREVIDILRANSPFYNTSGANASRSLKEMIGKSREHLKTLSETWEGGTIREVLAFCRDNDLLKASDRLLAQLAREPRQEDYNKDEHGDEKGDWLVDEFLAMQTAELQSYSDFVLENTPFSTQHGVKGEEFQDVLVVYDDVEAGWHNYNFTKLLTPQTSGQPTDGQLDRGRKLAYVCFSRARENLRILLFTKYPERAKQELIERELFDESQIAMK